MQDATIVIGLWSYQLRRWRPADSTPFGAFTVSQPGRSTCVVTVTGSVRVQLQQSPLADCSQRSSNRTGECSGIHKRVARNADTWATDVPYGQTNPLPLQHRTISPGNRDGARRNHRHGQELRGSSHEHERTSAGPGLTIAGVNSAGTSAVSAGAIGVLSYGSANTLTTSTAVVGQVAGQANVAGVTDSSGYLVPGTYTFTFTASAGGALCATSATYTITVARRCIHDGRRSSVRTEYVHLRQQLQPIQ